MSDDCGDDTDKSVTRQGLTAPRYVVPHEYRDSTCREICPAFLIIGNEGVQRSMMMSAWTPDLRPHIASVISIYRLFSY